jgi:hypothetical protein
MKVLLNIEDKIRIWLRIILGTICFVFIFIVICILALIVRIFDKKLFFNSDIKDLFYEKDAIKQFYKNIIS